MSAKTVTVTVNVPEGIMQFLNDIIPSTEFDSVKEYLEDAIVGRVQSDIENDCFNPKLKEVTERCKLEDVFSSQPQTSISLFFG